MKSTLAPIAFDAGVDTHLLEALGAGRDDPAYARIIIRRHLRQGVEGNTFFWDAIRDHGSIGFGLRRVPCGDSTAIVFWLGYDEAEPFPTAEDCRDFVEEYLNQTFNPELLKQR